MIRVVYGGDPADRLPAYRSKQRVAADAPQPDFKYGYILVPLA